VAAVMVVLEALASRQPPLFHSSGTKCRAPGQTLCCPVVSSHRTHGPCSDDAPSPPPAPAFACLARGRALTGIASSPSESPPDQAARPGRPRTAHRDRHASPLGTRPAAPVASPIAPDLSASPSTSNQRCRRFSSYGSIQGQYVGCRHRRPCI